MATAAKKNTKSQAKKSAAKKASAKKAQAKAKAIPPTRVERAREAAERLVAVPVGAALEARDNVVEAAEDMQARFGTTEAAEKQVKKFEKRGTKEIKSVERRVRKARTNAERRVRKTRTRVERELKARRKAAEKRAKAERKRAEQTAKEAAERLETVRESIRQIDLGTSVEFLQEQAAQAVKTGQSAASKVTERVVS